MQTNYQAVLFDLDGTLIDTAPDMGLALNLLLARYRKQPLAFEQIRPQVSHGAAALLKLGFGKAESDPGIDELRIEFLDIYRDNLAVHSALFDGMENLLVRIEASSIPWGIITNKPGYLTNQLLAELQLDSRTACVISGDTLEHKKPHPAPMYAACKAANVIPGQCLYVGDAQRDVEAAHAAGMAACGALYGYYPETESPVDWNADIYIDHPDELLDHINLACAGKAAS